MNVFRAFSWGVLFLFQRSPLQILLTLSTCFCTSFSLWPLPNNHLYGSLHLLSKDVHLVNPIKTEGLAIRDSLFTMITVIWKRMKILMSICRINMKVYFHVCFNIKFCFYLLSIIALRISFCEIFDPYTL